jgi:hypothetical protein
MWIIPNQRIIIAIFYQYQWKEQLFDHCLSINVLRRKCMYLLRNKDSNSSTDSSQVSLFHYCQTFCFKYLFKMLQRCQLVNTNIFLLPTTLFLSRYIHRLLLSVIGSDMILSLQHSFRWPPLKYLLDIPIIDSQVGTKCKQNHVNRKQMHLPI